MVPAMLLDCTLRDGGNFNNWKFRLDDINRILLSLDEAGVDVIEVGYRGGSGSNKATDVGITASCPASFLADLPPLRAKLAVMAVPTVCPLEELEDLPGSPVTIVRVASYPADFLCGLAHVRLLADAGLTVSANLMAASHVTPAETGTLAREAERSGAALFSIADSFGALHPDGVRERVAAIRDGTGLRIGLHAHDNLGLAMANALAAREAGATVIDGSLAGLARGAGNLRTELWAAACSVISGLAGGYRLEPLLAIADHVHDAIIGGSMPSSRREIMHGVHDLHYYYSNLVSAAARQAEVDEWEALRRLSGYRPVKLDRDLVAAVCAALSEKAQAHDVR